MVAEALRDQVINAKLEEVISAVAEHRLGLTVHLNDSALCVGDDHCVGCGLYDRLEPVFCYLGLLCLFFGVKSLVN